MSLAQPEPLRGNAGRDGASDFRVRGAESRPGDLSALKTKQRIMYNKSEIISNYKLSDKDTGSSEVQIALLSARIAHLTEHLRTHKKDFHSRHGLIALTNRRRKLLNYLKKNKLEAYEAIIQKLGLRR